MAEPACTGRNKGAISSFFIDSIIWIRTKLNGGKGFPPAIIAERITSNQQTFKMYYYLLTAEREEIERRIAYRGRSDYAKTLSRLTTYQGSIFCSIEER
jgi:hypothetical protein